MKRNLILTVVTSLCFYGAAFAEQDKPDKKISILDFGGVKQPYASIVRVYKRKPRTGKASPVAFPEPYANSQGWCYESQTAMHIFDEDRDLVMQSNDPTLSPKFQGKLLHPSRLLSLAKAVDNKKINLKEKF